MPYLDFRGEAHVDSTSWQRADPDAALIERTGPTEWLVTLPGGSAHRCRYGLERGGRVGYCDCEGFRFRDDDASPCAHLCTLRQADFIDGEDVRGQRVEAVDTFEEIEREIVADGGLEAAVGADGRTFGRPEGRL